MTDDRRRYPRTQISWPVRVWMDNDSLCGRAGDISAFGIGVVTDTEAPLKIGSFYRVDVFAEKDVRFTFSGEVRHVSDRGIGLATRQPLHRAGWFS